MINVAKTIVRDFMKTLPGGTSDTVAASKFEDRAAVRFWFDGAWYQMVLTQIEDPGLPLPDEDEMIG